MWFQVKYFQPASRTQPCSTISFDGLNPTHSAHTSISTALSCRQKPVVMLHVSPILVKWCVHNQPPPTTHQSPLPLHVTLHSPSLAWNTHGDTLPHRFHTRTHFYYYIFAPSETSHLDFKVGWCTKLCFSTQEGPEVREVNSQKKMVQRKCWNFVVEYVLELKIAEAVSSSISAGHLCICKNWLKTKKLQGFLLIVTVLLFFLVPP